MKKRLLILLSMFCITNISALEPLSYEIDEVATTRAPWKVGEKLIENEVCGDNQCDHEFLGVTKSGYLLVQEFYITGNKRSDPYLVLPSIPLLGDITQAIYNEELVYGSTYIWYESGQKKSECNFVNGEPIDICRGWNEQGQLIFEEDFGNPY